MKKIILSIAALAIGAAAFAQKPTSGNITTEIGLGGLLGAPANPATLNIPQGMLRFRYFLSDNMAVRAHLGFGSGSTTSKVSTAPGVTPVVVAESKVSTTGLGIAAGIEYHLAGTDKLSPYLGAEVGYGSGSTKTETTNSANANGSAPTTGNKFNQDGGATTTLAVNAFIGGDYYITEKVYIGAELGIGLFKSGKTAEQTTEVTVAGVTTKVTSQEAKSSSFGLVPNVIGQVRLGIVLF